MKRSVRLVLTALFLSHVAACGAEEPEYNRICLDEQEQRVDDEDCDDDDGHHRWFYVHHSRAVPAVGSRANTSTGTYVKPGGSIGSVSRGGFGGHGSGGSGS